MRRGPKEKRITMPASAGVVATKSVAVNRAVAASRARASFFIGGVLVYFVGSNRRPPLRLDCSIRSVWPVSNVRYGSTSFLLLSAKDLVSNISENLGERATK